MLARVITSEGKPEHLEAGLRYFRENIRPAARKMTGFKGAYFLVDRKSGKTLGMAQAAAVTKPPTVEVYEVAVQL